MVKNALVLGIIALFIVSAVSPMVIGLESDVVNTDFENEELLDNLAFYCYGVKGLDTAKYEILKEELLKDYSKDEVDIVEDVVQSVVSLPSISSGPMDSPWPMQCYDNHHTSRSPYSTAHIDGLEKWRRRGTVSGFGGVDGSPIIGRDGTIFYGDKDRYIYALFPNGTLKWKYQTDMWVSSAPAFAEDGTLYVCSWDKYLYALNSTDGDLEWRFHANKILSISSPAIAVDGTIYFGGEHHIFAVNCNGTEKWRYNTGGDVHSNPAIADDGTIYIGSWDHYLYAMNPKGSVRWRFKTGDIVKGSPSIGDDGTIYISSFDDHLYALYPNNGTMKWKCTMDYGSESNPSIANDGTLYVGSYQKFYAIYPNGTIKWTIDLGSDSITWSCPAISSDGTIYIGTMGGKIIAIKPDGTEKWRKRIANEWIRSSPCIGEDGTIYIGSQSVSGGYLHAFGPVESNSPPETPMISGEVNGETGEDYWYTFVAVDPDNNPISWYIDWGNGDEGWTSDRASGENCYYEHTWSKRGNYTIRAKARDTLGEESNWAYLEVTMPKNQNMQFRWLERFPLLQRLLSLPVFNRMFN